MAAVEFGPRVRAKSILAGGQSGDPRSPHFSDQAEMYSRGEFKDVLFYREDIEKQLERRVLTGRDPVELGRTVARSLVAAIGGEVAQG